MADRRDPLLPRPALIFLAIVAALGWLGTVAAALLNPESGGSLLIVTGLFATVIGASFGIKVGRAKNGGDSGDDTP